jgi:hypothetical protein
MRNYILGHIFDLYQKKLAAPFGAANFSLSHFLNVSITTLDQQRQVPYQPRCPRTS